MSASGPRRTAFGLADFGARLLASTIMVFASWNPSGFSFADWVETAWTAGQLGPLHAVFGVLLLIGWVILLRATFNSLGLLGLVLGGLLLGASVWLLFDLGVLRGRSMTLFAWIALSCVALLLALGLSWSYLWRRLTGQVDTDDFSPD
jgi:hypothetical protein